MQTLHVENDYHKYLRHHHINCVQIAILPIKKCVVYKIETKVKDTKRTFELISQKQTGNVTRKTKTVQKKKNKYIYREREKNQGLSKINKKTVKHSLHQVFFESITNNHRFDHIESDFLESSSNKLILKFTNSLFLCCIWSYNLPFCYNSAQMTTHTKGKPLNFKL